MLSKQDLDAARITPAGAGKTSAFFSVCLSAGDHPRRCGENRVNLLRYALLNGSPPRMRGKLKFCLCSRTITRITPADAGKTHAPRPISATPQDHPRGCGENGGNRRQASAYRGSPPRMRGKRRHSRRFAVITRITPADAGKTWQSVA